MGPDANIHLDADAYSFASAYASAKGMPLEAAVSELIRQSVGHTSARPAASRRLRVNAHGLLVKASSGERITPETVRKSSEDDLG